MFEDDYGNVYDSEEDYLKSKKGNDSYYFSIPFTYIKKKLDVDEYEDATAYMDVTFSWSDFQCGYTVSYSCDQESEINQSEGNSDLSGFWEYDVKEKAKEMLESCGIGVELWAFL